MSVCTALLESAAAGVAPALRAVDCMAGEMTASAFGRLFGFEGALLPALTICLTLYIACFAIMLLTGRTGLGVSSLVPRMITLGLVLTFATSWAAYSQVLWNLAVAGPDWIASVLTGSGRGQASLIFADRIDIVFAAIADAGEQARAAAGAEGAAPPSSSAGMFQPADVMWLGALLLLLGTVGVLLTARIALAVLMAVGPVFVVLGLFAGTRGLTAGWLRGVALTALAPLFVVLGGSITLELLVPVISALVQGAALGEISGRAALALFLLAAVHVALMAMIMKVVATMVSGWRVFGLAPSASERIEAAGRSAGTIGQAIPSAATASSPAAREPLAASALPAPDEARPGGGGGELSGSSVRRRATTLVIGGGIEPAGPARDGRVQGIGSRFRAASNDSGRVMVGRAGKENVR
ncbi:MAG: type IV secretion system protein [Alphaproteobacteria bacterium]|nr:type IV secretion system protein [Alphaproteobacteria bacterium]